MTENDEHQLPLTGAPSGESGADPAKLAKKAPRRKVATRLKAGLAETPAPDGTRAVEAPKPRRKPAPKAVKADPQTELLPVASPQPAQDPQTQIETRIIPKAVMEAVEQKTRETFGTDGNIPAPEPARHPVEQPPAGERMPVVEPRREDRPGEFRRDDRPGGSGGGEPRRDDRPGGGEFRREDRGPDHRQDHRQDHRRDYRGQNFQGGGGRFQDRNRHGQRQQFQGHPRDRDQGPRDPSGPRDQSHREQGPRDPSFRDQPQGVPGGGGGGEPLVSRPTEIVFGEGIIEVSGKGFGFMREAKRNFVQTPADVFVTPEVCRKYNLRDGQWIKGEIRRSSRGPQLFRLTELNGEDPEKFRDLPNFEELTTINPKKRIKLETVPERYTTRVMDLMTPIGKGQRGLIVAPPRTGKTTLLQHIAEAVILNHPEMKVIILLVDERPEEVTEMRRTVPQAEIMASSNDSDLKSHTRIAQLAMERGKRLVEAGFDVFMLLDSITRMGRAFNNTATGGRTGSGGIDSRALEIPRKIFAAARNTEEAGSLTIMATALIDTGSRGDEVIFLEFKGTGNMELVLDRKISDQRIYPAVDIFQSGTRREELLLAPWELDKINVIRRGLAGHKPLEAIERLLSFLKKFPTNAQMLASLPG